MAEYDIAIIGGGINGAGIARDAAGRGARVALVEQADLGCGTSSASTKLIHGGLRYLELKQFRLVRESLREREVLWRMAPHIIRPMRFVLPHHSGLRPAWQLRLGLLLYDHIGGRRDLPISRGVSLTREPLAGVLKPQFVRGFEYSDCWVDDARLVVLTAMDAAARGAQIWTRTRCVRAEREAGHWRLTLQNDAGERTIDAAVLVNAAGPWVAEIGRQVVRANAAQPIRLVKGSHIVVPKMFGHDRAYLLQSADGRVVFAIPYEGQFTLIGTTDIDFDGDLGRIEASADEITYLCGVASEYFRTQITPADVVHTYAGVRPLYDDGAARAKDLTRDYVLDLDTRSGEAPLLTIYGGKITTYRRLAEAALRKLAPYLKLGPEWTAGSTLPGGDFPTAGVPALIERAMGLWPYLARAEAERLVRAYGTMLDGILGLLPGSEHLGERMRYGLSQAEIGHMLRREFAHTAEDVLWRRSKLALHLSAEEQRTVAHWIEAARTAS